MSKTIKGKKGSGYEYWSKRPMKFKINRPGKLAKKYTHKKERILNKDIVRECDG